ncbi:hypothetical protein OJ967_26220 [Peribacillus frigoritolerans]|uniref:hypothetical protein n=1 Tax=Peribacillus frigoritolerans TaxID=450367 RepID=UPI0022280633|nr:hypothetical protein [Peribacillus frigoritolerans]UYY98796.1 hypothetical protein OJ967_26220 [Peribacillus frigoritolerans]
MSPRNLMATILIEYDGTAKYISEDVSNVYGEMTGVSSYQSQAGWDISIPSIFADSFDKKRSPK